ncbi:lasso peptide biosynthesis protein [Sphingomonas sanguinis]|uniref:Lasso peptide biosynthesis protein n=1 Tax=Sphingomonas sanguinis TaxID=33051 RepID=A0ABU5LQH2_9SPHN|nr:lasso peptide biosynthesis protein [Sphingomonas sanguinis]MDZ7282143.1 lasso peptide biosynthesis protein [Sphingomonas sanguinis]QXT35219.1 lasso peptide biosynthesis protein [Sphingomonas sanguinis]
MTITPASLMDIAVGVRSFLLPHWHRWHALWGPPEPATPSQWTCMRSSLLLARVFERCGIRAVIRSGRSRYDADCVPMDRGLFAAGTWESHAWIEVAGFVVDITADQFGHAPVVMTSACNPTYRAADDQRYQLPQTPAALAAVDAIWPLWRDSEIGKAGDQISG